MIHPTILFCLVALARQDCTPATATWEVHLPPVASTFDCGYRAMIMAADVAPDGTYPKILCREKD